MNFIKRKRKSISFIALISILTTLAAAATVYSAGNDSKVDVYCDGKVIAVGRTNKSVYDVLLTNGISIGTYDAVEPGLDALVSDVDCIKVRRAVKVELTDGGDVESYLTSAETVGDFLNVKRISVSEYDVVSPSLDTEVTDGMAVKIARGRREVTEEVIEIPYETERRENASLARNLISVARYGTAGTRTVKTETIYRDGELYSQKVVSDVITKQPVNEILDVGTKANTIVAPDGTVYTYSKVITCTATAYDASYESNGPWGAITATGKALASGMVAVDPRVIPLGTKLYIEAPDGSWSYGYAVAEDTGGAIKGNKIDLFYHTNYECRQFGRRKANVYILE